MRDAAESSIANGIAFLAANFGPARGNRRWHVLDVRLLRAVRAEHSLVQYRIQQQLRNLCLYLCLD